jgi:predicted MarR family transcription regulator
MVADDIYYPGAPNGLTATHQDQVNADLFALIRAQEAFGFWCVEMPGAARFYALRETKG